MKKSFGGNLLREVSRYRTHIVFIFVAFVFSTFLNKGDSFPYAILGYTALFWIYTYIEMSKKLRRPHSPETRAILKVSTEEFVDWAITNMRGDLVVSGWGNRTVDLPSTGTRIERDWKIKFSEYLYVAEVVSGNGDAFVSLTVNDDDEFMQTVACGRTGDPEILYTTLNIGYGTRHWLLPGIFQGIPR